jgi:hypothetical protein
MDVVMDCDLLVLCEYEFFTIIVLVEFNNYEKIWRKNIELNKHVSIVHYTIYKKN